MQDKRANPRRKLTERIEVIDANGGASLGYLVNISLGGFMLLSDTAPEVNRLFQLRMRSDSDIPGLAEMELGAECLWTQTLTESGHHWAGFQIIDLSEQAGAMVRHLLEEWSE